jgi:CRISPR-associated protein Cmr6
MDAYMLLPGTTSELIARVPITGRHAGLQLDKFVSRTLDQDGQQRSLADVCQAAGDGDFLKMLLHRRDAYLNSLGAVRWRCATTGPLTLHRSRASALENAGICLHPVYGFVYLPGTGLKGMARAYAETVWLPAQYQLDATGQPADAAERAKALAAWQTIEAVFGRVHPTHSVFLGERHAECAGYIVFHEAWPATWPKLEVDIAANHHAAYYQGSDSRDTPDDWESPAMDSFLAIGAGHTFTFALSKRRAEVPDDLLDHARQWLMAALIHDGAGAKTAAGYGGFRLCDELPSPPGRGDGGEGEPSGHAVFETTLELVTPAFLAGANQQADDCQLRGPSLRGLLRWWWRTMHAGFMEVAALRRLEAAVWGDAHTRGAVRLAIEPQGPLQPILYDHKDRLFPMPDFQREHRLQPPPNQKTNQGLFYASYGMDDDQHRRYYLPPGTRWIVRLVARKSYWQIRDLRGKLVRTPIDPTVVLQQAKAALWLLTHVGGVGSKSRKGFGSFADIFAGDVSSLRDCQQAAAAFRRLCRCDGPFHDRLAESPALERARRLDDVTTGWNDCWYALDQLGYAFQSFAQHRRHDRAKAALGLPRQIHGPRHEPMRGQNRAPHRPPEQLRGPKGDRYASPVFYHLGRTADGALLVRVTAFPTKHLPDLLTSTTVLNQLLQHLDGDLRKRAAQAAPERLPPRGASVPPAVAKPVARPAAPQAIPKAGHQVEAILVEDPKGRDRRFARHAPTGLIGPILNAERIPPEKNLGDAITLLVFSISSDGKQVQWRVPTETDKPRPPEPRSGPPRGPSRRR